MDELDTRILRELTQAGTILPAREGLRASLRNIARALGTSPGTVRNRVNRMYESGVLRGSSVYANPNLLGLSAGAYAFEVPGRLPKGEVVDRLRSLEGMFFLQNFRGSFVGLAFVFEDESARKRILAELQRRTGAKHGMFSRVLYPPCDVVLSKAEWRLVARLVRRNFSSHAALAKELGMSVRTLKRHLARLVAARAVFCVPTMDYRSLTGCVPADLIVSFSSKDARPEAEREIFKLVADRMIYAGAWADFGMYSLILPKVAAVAELGEQIPRIPGVGTSRVEIVDDHIDRVEVLREYVERRKNEFRLADVHRRQSATG